MHIHERCEERPALDGALVDERLVVAVDEDSELGALAQGGQALVCPHGLEVVEASCQGARECVQARVHLPTHPASSRKAVLTLDDQIVGLLQLTGDGITSERFHSSR